MPFSTLGAEIDSTVSLRPPFLVPTPKRMAEFYYRSVKYLARAIRGGAALRAHVLTAVINHVISPTWGGWAGARRCILRAQGRHNGAATDRWITAESDATAATPAACVYAKDHKTLRPKHRPVTRATRNQTHVNCPCRRRWEVRLNKICQSLRK